MSKINVKLLQLGYPAVDLSKLVGWDSEFFEIGVVDHVSSLPNSDGADWSYSVDLLSSIVGDNHDADLTLAVTDKPMENNYYLLRLGDKSAVLSLYETGNIIATENIPPEVFVIRNVYEMVMLYYEFEGNISADAYQVHHEDTRGCVFDFNAIKTDILASTRKVSLCLECKDRLSKKKLPLNFVEKMEKEFRRVRKPLSSRIVGFAKDYPKWAIAISLLAAFGINILSNIVYDKFKSKPAPDAPKSVQDTPKILPIVSPALQTPAAFKSPYKP